MIVKYDQIKGYMKDRQIGRLLNRFEDNRLIDRKEIYRLIDEQVKQLEI